MAAWILLAIFVALWKVKPIEEWLKATANWSFQVPLVFEGIQKMPPVAPAPEFEKGVYDFQFLAATGTALLFAGIIAGC